MTWIQAPDEEALRNSENRDREGGSILYIKNGITQIRVLPAIPSDQNPDNLWFREVKEHKYNLEGQFKNVGCLLVNCPLCDVGQEAYNSGVAFKVKLAKSIRPKSAFYLNAMVFSAAGSEIEPGTITTVKVVTTVKRALLSLDRDTQSGWEDITGARQFQNGEGCNGVSFNIKRDGANLETTYTVTPIPTRTKLEDECAKFGLDFTGLASKIPDLWTVIVPPTKEEMNALAEEVRVVLNLGGTEEAPLPPVFQAQTPEAPVTAAPQASSMQPGEIPAPPPVQGD